MMRLSQHLGMFNASAIRGMHSIKAKTPASLEIHIWHTGKENGDNYDRKSQSSAILESAFTDVVVKIPHASCELKIDFQHPNTPKAWKDIARSMLVSSKEHLLNKEGKIPTIEQREKILFLCQNIPLSSMQVYLSWAPGSILPNEKIELNPLQSKLIAHTRKKIDPSDVDFLLSKYIPALKTKENDFSQETAKMLETIVLYDLDYEEILQDLSKFIIFDCQDGIISAIDTTVDSRYYLLDMLRDYVLSNDNTIPVKPEHVCSTLVARVLEKGLGKRYIDILNVGREKVGHKIRECSSNCVTSLITLSPH